jgi:hypothetical protein
MRGDALASAVHIDSQSSCDCIDPRQSQLTRQICVADAMDADPSFLEQMISFFPVVDFGE